MDVTKRVAGTEQIKILTKLLSGNMKGKGASHITFLTAVSQH